MGRIHYYEGINSKQRIASTKKTVSLVLALLLAITLIPASPLSAFADEIGSLGPEDALGAVLEDSEANEEEGLPLDPGKDFDGAGKGYDSVDEDYSGAGKDASNKDEDASDVIEDNDYDRGELPDLQEPANGQEEEGRAQNREDDNDVSPVDDISELEALATPTFTPNVSVSTYNDLVSRINSAPINSQYVIRITASFGLPSAIAIPANKNIVITSDANLTLTTQGTHRHFGVSGALVMSGLLTLTDDNLDGGGVHVYNAASLTLYSGSISGNASRSSSLGPFGSGGGVYLQGGTLNMHGGSISNNRAVRGGGVFASASGQINLYGGQISNNTVRGIQAGEYGVGGGVYFSSSGTLAIYGGTIQSNTAAGQGAGVYCATGNLTLHDGVIRDNVTSQVAGYGGGGAGVFLEYQATFTMNGGAITANRAAGPGGGVVTGNSTFNMHGGSISDNRSASWGGGINNSSIFTMHGGTIQNNVCTSTDFKSTGGGIHNWNTFVMYGGTIRSNSAKEGGGVYSIRTVIVHGGTITSNRASTDGGGVYISSTYNAPIDRGTFTMNAGTISNNTAGRDGGGIFTIDHDRLKAISSTSVFFGNTAARSYDYGIANRGAKGRFPQINWADQNSIPGTHLLNNYDVSYIDGKPHTKPVITVSTLANGVIGTSYSRTLAASGVTPITWTRTSGSLPPGLSLSSKGVISGKPTKVGTYTFTVRASNSIGSNTKTLKITITQKPSITTGSTLESATTGIAYKKTLAASGTKSITWTRTSGSLPPGLSLSSAGVISGKPTKVGTYTFTVRATNSAGSATKTFKIVVERPVLAISYSTHVQTVGWQPFVKEGNVSGTTGKALRLEGIKINVQNTTGISGGISYATHIQSIGWQKKVSLSSSGNNRTVVKGPMSGTSGKALRLEAITIELTGDLKKHYDIYYRVHAQSIGWMGWARNGEQAGTAGHAYRLEGIQIVLVPKVGGKKPGNTFKGVTTPAGTRAFIKR